MAWLTSEAAAAETICRRFAIPVNLLPYFMGALDELGRAGNWEQFGTLTPDEMAELFTVIIESYKNGCTSMIGTVFTYLTDDPPEGSLALDGSTYNDVDYPVFAALIAGRFGNGDGTFTLPDARGRTIVGSGEGAGLTNRAVDSTFGEEAHQQLANEVALHNHYYEKTVVAASAVLGALTGVELGAYEWWATSNAPPPFDPLDPNPFNVMQPSIALPLAVWVSD